MATPNCTTVLVDQHTATPTHHFATYLEQRAGETCAECQTDIFWYRCSAPECESGV